MGVRILRTVWEGRPITACVTDDLLSIGDLAHRVGVSVPTVRYYEERGLIESRPAPAARASSTGSWCATWPSPPGNVEFTLEPMPRRSQGRRRTGLRPNASGASWAESGRAWLLGVSASCRGSKFRWMAASAAAACPKDAARQRRGLGRRSGIALGVSGGGGRTRG